MQKLLIRTLSGIAFVAIIVLGTLWNQWSLWGVWGLIGVLSIWECCKLIKQASVIKDKQYAYVVGTLYISLSISLITVIEPMLTITILTIVWINDTGAFIVGSTIGRHKMAPKISPKKSWEGFLGGVLFSIGAALVWYSLYWSANSASPIPTSTIAWAVFGLIIAIGAVLGDLIESKFKRAIGVKDSGTMIPGHGGILDRMDASFLAIPLAGIYIAIFDFVLCN